MIQNAGNSSELVKKAELKVVAMSSTNLNEAYKVKASVDLVRVKGFGR